MVYDDPNRKKCEIGEWYVGTRQGQNYIRIFEKMEHGGRLIAKVNISESWGLPYTIAEGHARKICNLYNESLEAF